MEPVVARPRPRTLDQFNLDLPPETGGGDALAPQALQSLGMLYLQAELEQAGVIPAAEALTEARASLQLPTELLAATLERFAQAERNWYDRPSREQLFARVFGTGAGATADKDAVVNHAFEQLLAALCSAINRYASDQTRFGPPPATDMAVVTDAANALLSNLGLRQYGNTQFATRRIQEQMDAAIALLKDHGIQAMFGANGFWPVLERILAPNVPDITRLVERGQAGQKLLGWLAGSASGGSGASTLAPDVLEAAAMWLAASGLDAGTSPAGSVV
jgi:hypothetical protein